MIDAQRFLKMAKEREAEARAFWGAAREAVRDAEHMARLDVDPRACPHPELIPAHDDGLMCCECGITISGMVLATYGLRYRCTNPQAALNGQAQLQNQLGGNWAGKQGAGE